MPASSAERYVRRRARGGAALGGGALGVAATAGGAPVAIDAGGTVAGVAVVIAVLVASLLVGLWAGAPAAAAPEPPVRERWVIGGVAFAAAGAVATMWALYSGVAVTPFGRVLTLLALVAAPAYALGLLFPLLLSSAERALESAGGESDAPPTTWGPLGDVVVGTLAGLGVIVPLAAVLVLPRFGSPPLFLVTSVLLLVPIMLGEAEDLAAHEEVLHEAETPRSSLRVTEVTYPGERQPERRLYLNDEQESGELVRSGAPTLAYIAAAEAWLTRSTPAGARYLFTGGGAFTLPRRIAERDPRASITAVEIDPEITRLAYRYFGLRRDHRISIVHGDARAFAERQAGGQFDRIYIDVYSGSESVPHHLVTRDAFQALHDLLAPDGAVGMNLIGVTSGPEAIRLWSVVSTVADVFPGVALYTHLGPEFTDLQNLLLLAAPLPDPDFPETLGVMDLWPPETWNVPAGATVFRDLDATSDAPAVAAPSASRPGSA
jgi:hypothetical protein